MPPRTQQPRKPLTEMDDQELREAGFIRINRLGGLLGFRIISLKTYNREQAAKSRKRQRAENLKKRKKNKRKKSGGGKGGKKKKWLIPGLIYW
jgi:hypothetical protein